MTFFRNIFRSIYFVIILFFETLINFLIGLDWVVISPFFLLIYFVSTKRFNTVFEQRAQLVSENIRLEQEVQDLRSLEIVNQELQLQLESYEAISTVSNIQNFELLSTGFITKNLNLEYLIYGGNNQQLEVGAVSYTHLRAHET